MPPTYGITIHYNLSSDNLARQVNTPAESFPLRMLLFADDILVLAETPCQLQSLLTALHHNASRWGLSINANKTHTMVLDGMHDPPATAPPPFITLNGSLLANVLTTKYLGSWVSSDCTITSAVNTNIHKAKGAFHHLHHIWRNKHLSPLSKVHIFNLTVMPILLYAVESWPATSAVNHRLASTFHSFLRQALGKGPIRRGDHWRHQYTNADLLTLANMLLVDVTLRKRRMQWLGHMLRMSDTSIVKRFLLGRIAASATNHRVTTLCKTLTSDLTIMCGPINGIRWIDQARRKTTW